MNGERLNVEGLRGRIEDEPHVAALAGELVALGFSNAKVARIVSEECRLKPGLSPSSIQRWKKRHAGENAALAAAAAPAPDDEPGPFFSAYADQAKAGAVRRC